MKKTIAYWQAEERIKFLTTPLKFDEVQVFWLAVVNTYIFSFLNRYNIIAILFYALLGQLHCIKEGRNHLQATM